MSDSTFISGPVSMLVPAPRGPLSEGNAKMRFHVKRQAWRDSRRLQATREAELRQFIAEMRHDGHHALAEQSAGELEADLREAL